MIILFILGILLGAAAVFFALQNTEVVTVVFFNWQLTSSLSVIIILGILLGVATVILLLLPESLKNYFSSKKLKKEIHRLEEELRKQKELTTFAKSTPPTAEDLRKISEGEIIHPEV